MTKLLHYIRIKDWWAFIIPPVVAFYYAGLLRTDTGTVNVRLILGNLILFILLTGLTAAFGFFLNEWTDIGDDKTAGKNNALQEVSRSKTYLIFTAIVLGILFIGIQIRWEPIALAFFIIQLLLFILYSVRPFRLKSKKYAAVILDALYSGTLFYIIAAITGAGTLPLNRMFIICIFCWGAIRGIRNILLHLIRDKEHDILLPIETFATESDTGTLQTKIAAYILPMEAISFSCLLIQFPYPFLYLTTYLLFMLYLQKRPQYIVPYILKRKQKIEQNKLAEMNLFYELVLPFITVSLVVYEDARLFILFPFSVLLFPQILNWATHLITQLTKKTKTPPVKDVG